MDCSPAGFPALRQLAELVQTCGHWVDDAIQPSHPLLPPSPSGKIYCLLSIYTVIVVAHASINIFNSFDTISLHILQVKFT